MIRVALAGNPNVGKSTLFNVLTGARQHIGNWPGVTVDKKVGRFRVGTLTCEVTDLPGLSDFSERQTMMSADQRIASDFLASRQSDTVICVVDATSLTRGLYIATQLRDFGLPMVVALNMSDLARRHGLRIDCGALEQYLNCEVVSVSASRYEGIAQLKAAVGRAAANPEVHLRNASKTTLGPSERYRHVEQICAEAVSGGRNAGRLTDRLDALLLNPVLGLPLFLAVVYFMFLVTIGVGGAFIDFFDGVGSALFVEGPRTLLLHAGAPDWLSTFIADGVGGGVQLVGTFIPIIGTLFLCLSLLESSGYMARTAFLMDRLLRKAGLPGHAFLPLIIGFGCNVPAVMATRALPGNAERVFSALMAPYMSCGARLTVYALFAAAFFRGYAAEIVFLLYVIGILVAVITVLLLRSHLVAPVSSGFTLEMPSYHVPRLGNVLRVAWHRLRDFVVRAGKAIVIVVVALNILNSLGTDGSYGNENTESSVLSEIGKRITPILAPMGVEEDNWPAAVGLFTGMFAKEVVVGTFDALYSEAEPLVGEFQFWPTIGNAISTIPENLLGLGESAADPLAFGQVNASAAGMELVGQATTVEQLRRAFSSDLAAFCYLMFILLYIPCVATVGALFRELGSFFAVFSVAWSLTLAYSLAVICYQLGTYTDQPLNSSLWILGMAALIALVYVGFVRWGLTRGIGNRDLIAVRQVQ
ncbi:MAG: ferrous iron transport protein B [Gammaproteobacteria bacterium]|nr:ferrous iron transport protein B [Gammaproteobacteria bacterium]